MAGGKRTPGWGVLLWALPVASVLLPGCQNGKLSAAEASRLSEAHLPSFLSFERWSHRVLDADAAFPSGAALQETLFSPLVLDSEICGAWVTVERDTLSFPAAVPHDESSLWTRIRVAESREIDVRLAPVNSPRTRDAKACVLLRRAFSGRRARSVTVAFKTQPD